MSVTYKTFLACLITGIISSKVYSEETNPIIVSATRSEQSTTMTPASITVISREEIEQSGARHITELLRTAAGIQLKDLFGDGARASISMRGFAGSNASSNSLIMIDGRRLNNIDTGAPNLNSISINDVERIEIIHGSAGTLFGDQAVGGVINIITRGTQNDIASIEAGIGSYSKQHLAVQFGRSVSEKLRFRLSAESIDTDNYREHNKKDFQSVHARLDYKLTTGGLFAELQTTSEELEFPGALTTAQYESDPTQANPFYPDDYNDTDTDVARIGIQHSISQNIQLEAEYTSRSEDSTGILSTSNIEQSRDSKSLNPRIITNWSTQHGEALLTIGIDQEENDYHIESPFGETTARQESQAIYAQLLYPLLEDVTATLGMRHAEVENHINDSFTFPTGIDLDDDVNVAELGLSWQLNNTMRVFTRLDENFRFAKIDEQTFTSPGVTGLKTQTGKSYELGVEWQSGKDRAKLLAYRLDLDNEIDYDSTAPHPFGFGANANLSATRREGVVLEGRSQLSTDFSLSGQVTYVDATFSGGSFNGNAIPFVAEFEAKLSASYHQNQNLGYFVEAHYIGERYKDSDFANVSSKLPGFTIFNANLQYHINQLKTGLRINNLFDKKYPGYALYNSFSGTDAYYPAPERNAELYVKYEF